MKYMLIAEITEKVCSGDISTCCDDYGIALYLRSVQRALGVIHFVVPVILIIMATINLAQLMLNPDDPQKKKWKSLINKFIAAIIVFFVPMIANIIFSFMPDSFDIKGCWNAANQKANILDTTAYTPQSSSSSTNNTQVASKNNNSNNNSNNSNKSVNKATLLANAEKKKGNRIKKTTTKVVRTSKGEQVVNYARQFLGNPYVYGGTSLTHGTDCSGFVMSVYKKFGINLPRVAQSQSMEGKPVKSLSDAQPGDLFFYLGNCGNGPVCHVSMYEGNGKVIHASNENTGIIESNYMYRNVYKIKRFL